MGILDTPPTSLAQTTAIATAAAQGATLADAFGSTRGAVVNPAAIPPTIGPNVWTAANFVAGGGRNTTQPSLSLTGNGTSQNITTWINMQPLGSGEDSCWRIEFDYDATAITSGWAGLSILAHDGTGTPIAGTGRQYLVNASSSRKSGHVVFDFAPKALFWDLEVKLEVLNNVPSGAISVTNLSLRFIPTVVSPLYVSRQYQGASYPSLTWLLPDVKHGARKSAFTDFATDGALTPSLCTINGSVSALPFVGATQMADPSLGSGFGGSSGGTLDSAQNVSSNNMQLRVGNNDQVMYVWNGSAYELRGNAHGGETVRGSVTYKIDQGSGLTSWTLSQGTQRAYRWQMILPTQITTTTSTTFANVDHTLTCFYDGMMRMDRTMTFLANIQIQDFFEWMSSHDIYTPMLGRVGRGRTVIGEIDTFNKLAAPTLSATTTSTSGGTLAAATYSYTATAVNALGETTAPTASTVTTTGATSSNTVNWGAVTGATGYRIYGRTAGYERLLATVASTATSWVDDGSTVAAFTAPPTFNTARKALDGSTQAANAFADSTDATWAVWYEPTTGLCYGNIFDRESVLARTGVAYVRTRLSKGSGTQKNYTNLFWTGGAASYTVPSGTVWTATHWSYVYCPYDSDRYHEEIAIRAANLASLKTIYPST